VPDIGPSISDGRKTPIIPNVSSRGRQPSGFPTKITQIERRILVVLCSRALDRPKWDQLADALATHVWREPEHHIVYAALRQIRIHDPKTWREQLPAQATRMGFPEVDWQTYIPPTGKFLRTRTGPQISKMLHTLKTLAEEKPD